MLDPISALEASSFSKKGIIAVATDTNCLGDTSIKSTSSLGTTIVSPLALTVTFLSIKWPSSSKGSFACATKYWSSSSAVKYRISPVATPAFLSTIL